MALGKGQLERLRAAPMFKETCPHCGEARLMWKQDWEDGKAKLWLPFHFHFCSVLSGAEVPYVAH